MPVLISDRLGVPHSAFEEAGVFDCFVDIDSALHVDPHLLPESEEPEFRSAYDSFRKHFEDVFRLVLLYGQEGDAIWRAAWKKLTFPELAGFGLGHSQKRAKGSAIGPKLAKAMVSTARTIAKAGVEDPVVFELVGLFEDNIGPDRISDMVLHITLPHIAQYTARIAAELSLPTKPTKVRGAMYDLPFDPVDRQSMFLVPQDVLRDLPIALSWSEVDAVASYSSEVREAVNKVIGESFKGVVSGKVGKKELLDLMTKNPPVLLDLIEQYKNKPGIPYDFKDDPAAEQWRIFKAQNLAQLFGGDFKSEVSGPLTPQAAEQLVADICAYFGKLLSDNGANELLFDAKKKPLKERAAQRLFYIVAHGVCRYHGLDLTPEPNAGRGPVDFKISHGTAAKVLVELKLSTHRRIPHGFSTQLPQYMESELADAGILLIIQVNDDEKGIKAAQELRNEAILRGEKPPRIIVLDARLKPSASKLDG